MNADDRFSQAVDRVLRKAGWFPGRRLDPSRWSRALDHPERPDGFRITDVAQAALAEFGGLKLRPGRTGVDHAPNKVDFNPLDALGEEDRFDAWSAAVGSRLYPIGTDRYRQYWVVIDEGGRVFTMGMELHYVGRDITEAMENLVLGRHPADFFELECDDEG